MCELQRLMKWNFLVEFNKSCGERDMKHIQRINIILKLIFERIIPDYNYTIYENRFFS